MKLKHHAFVTEYLKHRDAYLAYVHVYNVQSENYIATLSSANRLLNRPDISAAIQAAQDSIRAEVEYELKQELKKELLTVQRKRELLAQIATGELYVMQYYKGKDCNHCSQHVAPTINQMLRAIDLDNRLAGHYPDIKHHNKQFPSPGGVRGGSLAPETHESQQNTTKKQETSPPAIRRACPAEAGGVLRDLPSAGSSATGEVPLATNNPVIAGPDQLSHETPIQSQQTTTKTQKTSPPESGGEKSSQRTAECFSGVVTLVPELTQNTLRNNSIRATKLGSTVVP